MSHYAVLCNYVYYEHGTQGTKNIGDASYGTLGHVPPSLQTNFSGHFTAAQTLKFDSMWLPISEKNILAYSFVSVYCMNFIIFLCVTLKLFSLIFVPLLTSIPGDATGKEVGLQRAFRLPCF